MNEQPVRLSTSIIYALPAFGLALMGVTFYVLLPKFYTDTVGISGTVLGVIILASRVWDGVLDPTLGYLSDRTQSRYGRRKPWMGLATIPLLVLFSALLYPQLFGDSVLALGLVTFLFFVFWTAVAVPYQSLGAELSVSYTERTKVLAFRDGALVFGTLGAVIIPEILAGAGIIEPRNRFAALAGIYSVVLFATLALCLVYVPERRWREDQRPTGPILLNLRAIAKNKPFMILLIAYIIGGFGSQLPATLFLYYVQYVLESDRGPLFLLLYFGVGFLFLPMWVWLARRFGKKESWIAAMTVNAGSFVGVLFLGAGEIGWYTLIVVCSGIGFGGTLALPSSMQADVIDYGELQTGTRQEGQITGLWLVANKFSAALGAGLALPLIELSGYVPNAAQPEAVVSMLRWLYGGVPCLCYGLAIFVACYYPINAKSFERIRSELASRRAA